MKYRFTLIKRENNLILTISDWQPLNPQNINGELFTTQMIEDFMPKNYFLDNIKESLGNIDNAETEFVWPFAESTCNKIINILNALASPERYGRTSENYIGLIGKTPLVKLNSLADECDATVLVKLENMEPNSVKDRPVLSILEQAVKRGDINDNTETVEASSGNVAFALSAILHSLTNKKPRIFISKMHGKTKIRAVRISGVPVMLTAAAEGTASAKKASIKYAESQENIFQVNQHGNPDNPRAHRLTTGPEIYHQCQVMTGQPPAEFVTGLGSCGTAIGVAMFRDDINADFKVIGVEPEEASLLTGKEFNAHRFSGLAPGFITGNYKAEGHLIDEIVTISWQEGFEVCRRMLIEEGYLTGASTGASVGAALHRAKLPENRGKVIVTIAHDRGDRYLNIDDLYRPPETAEEIDLEN